MNRLSYIAAALTLCSLSSHAAPEDPPVWWDAVGIGADSTTSPESRAPANIGQVKNMAYHFHAQLEEILPGGAGFELSELFPDKPATPDQAWYDQQKAAANLGQLKHIASRFYDRLNAVAPAWVTSQMALNASELAAWPHSYPWDPSTPTSENYKALNLGQLKLVFSLRIKQDLDGDSLSDLQEHILYGSTNSDGSTTDFDSDGLSDRNEILYHLTSPYLNDSDGDGVSDEVEVENGTAPRVLRGLETGGATGAYSDVTDLVDIPTSDDVLESDTDGDGLNTSEELTYGTSPFSSDTDGDGVSDYDEIHTYSTDPTVFNVSANFVSTSQLNILSPLRR